MMADRTLYVVDDDAAVRRSLERLLDAAGFHVVSYESPAAFLEAASGLSAGCILLDIRMPAVDGLEVLARLNRLRVQLPVIVMTGHGDVPSAVRAMKAGAVDFLEKPFGDKTLLKAIEGAYVKVSRFIGDREAERAAQRIATLSPREREVLDGLLAGRPNKVIAFDLNISVRTVEVHRARMMGRLGTKQFADAIRLAMMAKLAPRRNRGQT
jgi:two-component system, LuxR family, response regulator FixJ